MKENKTESKPSAELVQEEITHSRTPKFRLKFTDYATEKYQANFIIKDKNGNIKIKDRDYVPMMFQNKYNKRYKSRGKKI
jgi:hypothetical protein